MIYFLSLGSNKRNKIRFLQKAVLELQNICVILKKSAIYKTLPVGAENQAEFLNVVLKVECLLNPADLLSKIKEIESTIGRTSSFRWGPREIDIDIIEYQGSVIQTPVLQVPHTAYEKRGFVLVPLQQIEPDFLNRRGLSLDTLIEQSGDSDGVTLYKQDW